MPHPDAEAGTIAGKCLSRAPPFDVKIMEERVLSPFEI
jgi:hypothetical protein